MTRIQFKRKDGTIISVCANEYAYCTPRENNAEYIQVEIGMWSKPIPELVEYAEIEVKPDGQLTVYPYVPVEILGKLLTE